MKNNITNSDKLLEEKENNKKYQRKRIIFFWFVALIHVGLAIFACIRYKFPVFYWSSLVFIILILLPSGIITYILIRNKETIIHTIILALCVCYLPVSLILSFCAFDCSQTYEIKNYLNTDIQLSQVELLFPQTLPISYNESQSSDIENVNTKYYYYYTKGSNYTCDVYAEFTLTQEEFSKEMERIAEFYNKEEQIFGSEVVFKMQYGDYKCFVISPNELFVDVEHEYNYTIFAYDEQNLRVRYIVCINLDEYKTHQPYYLQLDW